MKTGIYCLENYWGNSIKDKTSVQPILELLEKANICRHIYHRCATRTELEYMLSRWKLKAYKETYSILYFAFHGSEEGIQIGNEIYSLTDIGDILENACEGRGKNE